MIVPVPNAPAPVARIVAPLTLIVPVSPVPLNTSVPLGVPLPAVIAIAGLAAAPLSVQVPVPTLLRISKLLTVARFSVPVVGPSSTTVSVPLPPAIVPNVAPVMMLIVSLPLPRLIEPIVVEPELSVTMSLKVDSEIAPEPPEMVPSLTTMVAAPAEVMP